MIVVVVFFQIKGAKSGTGDYKTPKMRRNIGQKMPLCPAR